MEQKSRVNNPKPWIAQLFCRHHGEWFKRQEPYFNLSGETQYKVCTKCGKVELYADKTVVCDPAEQGKENEGE